MAALCAVKSLLPLSERQQFDLGATLYHRSTKGRFVMLALTAKQWRVIGAGLLVMGALLISLPLILPVLLGLGRLLFLIIMIIVISVSASIGIRQIPRLRKSLEDRRKALNLKDDSHEPD